MKKILYLLIIFLCGCNDKGDVQIATLESQDLANKVIVLLENHKVNASLNFEKESYFITVNSDVESKAREILTRFNFYFQKEDLNELLESKFASLSKLEMVKGNLLEGREIYNKLSVIPGIVRVNVVVTGDKRKRVSVLVMSFTEIDITNKNSIERFLKGVVDDGDKLTVSYFVGSNLQGDFNNEQG